VVERVNHAPFGEDAPVGVTDPTLELGQVVGAELGDLGVTQGNETGLQVLGQRVLFHGVISQPSRQIELSYRCSRPIDHGGRQYALDLQLLANPDQHRVDAGGIDVGELGQVAHTHDHSRIGVAAPDIEIAVKRGSEAKA